MKDNENIYTVYEHADPESGMHYVGITKQSPERRWQKGLGYVKNADFYKLIQQRGWDKLEHRILKDKLTQQAAMELEENLIKQRKLQNELNMRGGGYSNTPSEAIKKRIAESLLGHEVSEETRERIRNSIPSRGISQYGLDGKRLIKRYRSLSEAAREIGGLKPNIWAAANGKRPTYKGYKWAYDE